MCEPDDQPVSIDRANIPKSMRYSTYRLRVREELCVDLVHCSEVVHVCKEDVDLDCLCEAGTAGLEDGATEKVC